MDSSIIDQNTKESDKRLSELLRWNACSAKKNRPLSFGQVPLSQEDPLLAKYDKNDADLTFPSRVIS
ncbi:uncharacterized protein PHALS_13552 [Plasmopara halstedii]|uniref:Uncharacterized protein n=1 Tax=Plasmopara halstedii TaxID=4781 RepID=A0A0P1AP93_PLAHL|nr:uncharacterized protein PHALS_13552 [Plasmopara halstedii]CEG43352.1 hypothetical protein PHALS_13552 [Plasmopara halstedii]|eukprot:XP_024579721.1 hypothetical protein PHALS_13552 [Plasmopara halstedii]